MSNYSENQLNDNPDSPWYKISQLVPVGSKVLDVGCSSGNLGEALTRLKKCKVTGIDLNETDIKTASSRLTAAHIMDIEKDDVSKLGKFDCVIFADVLEHLGDPVGTLKKVKKELLNESGSVIFSIPNMAHMGTRLMLLKGRFVYGETGLLDKTHLHFYDKEEVGRIFKDAGYTLEVFDWVERYMPESVLSKSLNEVGLKPSTKFFKINKQVESTAYEFVGKAVPKQHGSIPQQLPFVSPNVEEVERQIKETEAAYKQKTAKEISRLRHDIEMLKENEARLVSSLSWRLTAPLRLVNGVFWHQRQRIKRVFYQMERSSKLHIQKYPELLSSFQAYKENDKSIARIKRGKGVKTAVVMHLYYTEAWPAFHQKLSGIKPRVKFDLFVTLPKNKAHFAKEIEREYPSAHIYVVPNRGRDVLPFVKVASHLEASGYRYILKIHSKKSPHYKEGGEWFANILNNLLPDKPSLLESMLDVLNDKNTGIVGPKDQYISLLVNYDANSVFFAKLLTRIYSKDVSSYVYDCRGDYGFFAGTMFWARLDALRKIFDQNLQVWDFEYERGRIDGTKAHALERVFCIVPQLEHRNLYEIGPYTIKRIAYATNNIPTWSDIHPDNRRKRRFRRR